MWPIFAWVESSVAKGADEGTLGGGIGLDGVSICDLDGWATSGDADIGAVLFGIDNGDVIDFFMSFGWDDNGGI
jgi:hypothetical protein